MNKKSLYSLLGVLVLLSMVLSACAQTPIIETVIVTEVVEREGTPEVIERVIEVVVTPTSVPATGEPTQPELQPADTVVIAMQQEPDTLHPLIGSMSARSIAITPVYMGCILQNDMAEWVPIGCEEVPTLENGGAVFVGEGVDRHLEVTYKIRDGWAWSDGTPVTADDAIYAWKLVMDPEMEVPTRNTTEKIYDMVKVDDSTFTTVFMSEAQAKQAAAGTLTGNVDFAAFQVDYEQSGYADQVGPVVDPVYWNVGLAAIPGSFLPAHVMASIPAADHKSIDFTTMPGDGPYFVKEWNQGQELVLERRDVPFPLGEPAVKTIIFRFFAESAAIIAALQNGEVDAVTSAAGGLTVANAPDLDQIEAAGLYEFGYAPGYSWEHIDLNVNKFPLDDVRVRKALYHAVDKQALVDSLYFGKQGTTDLPVPPGLSWAYTDSYVKYPFDLERAQELLAEAGWDCSQYPCVNADGEVLEITLMTTDRGDRQALAQVIQQMWRQLNVGVNLQFLYGRGLFVPCSAGGPLYCRTYDAAIYTATTGDDPAFIGTYDCAGIPSEENGYAGQNFPGWCNPEADEALIMNEVDPEVSLSRELRYPYIEEFFKIWTEEVPVIPLFSNTRVWAHRPGFENFKPGPTQFAVDTWNVWEWEISK
jgi:peptide/nickel transport system substrate-binding protein